MKQFFAKPFRFSSLYGAVLVLFALFVVLDTFVIPHGYTVVDPSPTEPRPSVSATDSDKTDTETTDIERTDSEEEDLTPQITANSYKDANISITVTTMRVHSTDVHVAEVILSSPEYLKTAFAKNTYGRNIKETTSVIADRVGAILAVNGDFYGFRNEGYVIRNGVLYREDRFSSSREDLVIDQDGRMYSVLEGKISAADLWYDGAEQVLSFGPVLVEDYEIQVDEDDEIGKLESNPRCAVGMIEPLHYLFVVSDGRTKQSAGLSLLELAEFMWDWDCQFAYNLDGGGSATMVFNGKVINNPTDGRSSGERKVSDIVCIGY
ncbi:MAG: phosphodiester glycosidase family protein [Clostridia bacterium]|nr:phosphodiester glycosidase family protein [Clostridia bacterium]